MEQCVRKEHEDSWTLPCDMSENAADRELLIQIIVFTSLLIEHSFSKHVYNSMEHLTTLLASTDLQVVLAVLNLLYVFSKRSNFISRLSTDRRQLLLTRLNYLAEVCHKKHFKLILFRSGY
jgi:E3 ubiquitin-protein ligase HUWE1